MSRVSQISHIYIYILVYIHTALSHILVTMAGQVSALDRREREQCAKADQAMYSRIHMPPARPIATLEIRPPEATHILSIEY